MKIGPSFPGAMPGMTLPRPMGLAAAQAAAAANLARVAPVVTTAAAAFYPTPAFQNHIEQLGKLARFLFPLPILRIGLCSS
jgi:hypothetical protein